MALAVLGMGAEVYLTTDRTLTRLVVLVLAVNASWIGYELLRPQLFTFVLTPRVVLPALRGRRVWLWMTPLVIGVWANLHGGWIGGWAILAGLSATLALGDSAWVGHRREPRSRAWEAMLVPVVAAPFSMATPFGWRTVTVALEHLDSGARLLDREWMPLWHVHQLVPVERHGLTALAAVTVLAVFLLPRRQLRYWALLVVADHGPLGEPRPAFFAHPPGAGPGRKLRPGLPACGRCAGTAWSGWAA